MKKSFSILGAFCLGLFISVSIIACAVDDEYNGNNPSEPTPQEEQVPYVVGIYTDSTYDDKTLEFTYENGAIAGWVIKDNTDQPICRLRVEIVDGSSVLVRYTTAEMLVGPREFTFQCNCNLHKIKSKHTERYNALISQIMMWWHIQYM